MFPKELLNGRHLSYAKLCERLSERTGRPWKEQRFGKIMNGGIRLRLEDVIWISRASGISLVEIMREPGTEFVANLTPSELRLVQLSRERQELLPLLNHMAELAQIAKPARRRRGADEESRARLRELVTQWRTGKDEKQKE